MRNFRKSLIAGTAVLCLAIATFAGLSPTLTRIFQPVGSDLGSVLVEVLSHPALTAGYSTSNLNSFHFLEPLTTRSGDFSKFDPSLLKYLTVDVCEVTSSDCLVVKTFTSSDSSSAQLRITTDAGNSYYVVNWDTTKFNLNRKTYRIRVTIASLELGSIDLTPEVYTKFGRTWPIKFLIEKDPVIRVRLVRWLGQSCSKAASVLKLEFNLSAAETAVLLAGDQQPCSTAEIDVAIAGVYQDVIIPDTTKITDELTRNALLSYDKTTGRMTFSTETALLKTLNVNDVMASEPGPGAPYGYLRKVVSKRKDRGQLVLETVQAKLTEAITKGSLIASGKIVPSNQPASGAPVAFAAPSNDESLAFANLGPIDEGGGFNIPININEVINLNGNEDGVQGTGTISITGSDYINAGYNVGIGVETCKKFPPVCIDRFEAWTGFEQKSRLRVTGQFNGELHKEKLIYPVPLNPILFFIGPFPVVLVPKVEVLLRVDGKADLAFVYEAEATSNIKAGAKWTDPGDGGRGWENITEDKVLSYQPVEDNLDADMNMEAGAKVNARIYLYDLLGPGMDGRLAIGADVQSGRKPFWKIYGRITSGVNFGAGVDDLVGIGTWEKRLPDAYFEIARSVNSPPVFSEVINPVTAKPGVPITLGPLTGALGEEGFFKVSDPEGDPVTITSAKSRTDGDLVSIQNGKVRAVFPNPGQRIVDIVASDSDGAQRTLPLTVNVVNQPPEITFTTFLPNFPAGVQYFLTARVNDPETGTLPCGSLTWSVDPGDIKTESVDNRSCTVAVVFNQPGTHNITATATDKFGASSTRTRTVNVTTAPVNPAPVIDVDSFLVLAAHGPIDQLYCATGIFCEAPEGATLFNGETGDYRTPLTLSLTASDPQGEPVQIVEWRCVTGPGVWQVAQNNGDGTYSCSPFVDGGTIAVFAIVTDGTTQVLSETRTFNMLKRINPN